MIATHAPLWAVIFLITLALAFDFINGFHDSANSIATVVSTGVLKPGTAVLFAAIFNFLALFIFQLSVAATNQVHRIVVFDILVGTYMYFNVFLGNKSVSSGSFR